MTSTSTDGAWRVWVMALGLTCLSILIHVTSPSSLHLSEETWERLLEAHLSERVFAARPFTNSLVVGLHDFVGLSVRTSFFMVQFLLLFLMGPAFHAYLRRLGFAPGYARAGLVVFYLSLPVFLAHFEPVGTWSDFWTYLFLTFGLTAALSDQPGPGALALALAILARETSVLFLPFWSVIVYRRSGRSVIKAGLYAAIVILAVVAVRFWLLGVPLHDPGWRLDERLYLITFNLAGFERARDTLFSAFVAFGAFWPTAVYQAWVGRAGSVRHWDLLRWGVLITVPTFLAITLFFMQARETRLFFPPFVFVIPIVLAFVQEHLESMRRLLRRFRPVVTGIIMVVLVAAAMGMATVLFPQFEYRRWHDGNRVYFGLHLAMIVLWLVVVRESRRAGT